MDKEHQWNIKVNSFWQLIDHQKPKKNFPIALYKEMIKAGVAPTPDHTKSFKAMVSKVREGTEPIPAIQNFGVAQINSGAGLSADIGSTFSKKPPPSIGSKTNNDKKQDNVDEEDGEDDDEDLSLDGKDESPQDTDAKHVENKVAPGNKVTPGNPGTPGTLGTLESISSNTSTGAGKVNAKRALKMDRFWDDSYLRHLESNMEEVSSFDFEKENHPSGDDTKGKLPLAAIRCIVVALYYSNEAKDLKIKALEAKNITLEQRIDALERIIYEKSASVERKEVEANKKRPHDEDGDGQHAAKHTTLNWGRI